MGDSTAFFCSTGWSVCSGIHWSVSSETGGQFAPKRGGQFRPEQVVSLNWNGVVNFTEFSTLSSALENPKPVTFDWKAKSYLILLAVLLSTTAASLATIRCSNEEIEQGHRIAARYKMARQLFPRLTNTIDEAFGQTADPSIDSLQHAWESHDPELKKASNGRRKKR